MRSRLLALLLVGSFATGCFGGAQPEPPNNGENDPDVDNMDYDAGDRFSDSGSPTASIDAGVSFDGDAEVSPCDDAAILIPLDGGRDGAIVGSSLDAEAGAACGDAGEVYDAR